jgi:hypothetical protein
MNFNILQSYAMSNSDIYKIIGKDSVIMYPDFADKKSIFECLDDKGRCVIFFETVSKNVGHWECLFVRGKTIYFFDSYGLGPDKAQKFLRNNTKIVLKENKPYLTNLLNDAKNQGFNWVYNNKDYQSWKGDIETCGKHVCNRLLNLNMDNDQYLNYMNQMKAKLNVQNYDNVVEEIIYKILGK